MLKKLMRLSLSAFLLGLGSIWSAGGGSLNVVVHAKATKKLSAELTAVRLSGGKLIGVTADGGAVVEVSHPNFAAAEAKIKEAGASKVLEKVPEQIMKVQQLIISYQANNKPSAEQLTAMGLKIDDQHEVDNVGYLLVQPTNAITAATVTALQQSPFILHAEVNQTVSIPPMPIGAAKQNPNDAGARPDNGLAKDDAGTTATPNDLLYSKQWGMGNIHAPRAWDKVTSSVVIVADIDTGADLKHPDLEGNLIPGFDFINNTPIGQDENGHGTHTAGTIGAVGNNKMGVAGTCWKVKIMPLRFLDKNGSGSTFNAVKAVDYARTKGARIMSNSWGGSGFSQALADAITRAEKDGILFVAAAGNAAMDNDATPFYPAGYVNSNIISVAAIDQNDKKATFSDFGKKTVHIGAPGVNIISTLLKSGPLSDPTGFGNLSGTSMATPHVSALPL